MSKIGTFEYQRDMYARMLVDIMVLKSDEFNAKSTMSTVECSSMVNRFFDVNIDNKWYDILVNEYPDLFSFTSENKTIFHTASDVAYMVDI